MGREARKREHGELYARGLAPHLFNECPNVICGRSRDLHAHARARTINGREPPRLPPELTQRIPLERRVVPVQAIRMIRSWTAPTHDKAHTPLPREVELPGNLPQIEYTGEEDALHILR